MALSPLNPHRWIALLTIALAIVSVTAWRAGSRRVTTAVQRLASPGPLSAAHGFLQSNCAACHRPFAGVEAPSCIACHAVNAPVVNRQPTAFHATIASCATCHGEHRGRLQRPTTMDHAALDKDSRRLDCVSCHATKDPHRERLGTDCANCHALEQWSVPAFQHPSPRSTACASCHLEPPSHRMGHFRMVSQRVAKQPRATVEQCYACHQTTSWNDIVGVGWYKHH